MQLLNTMMCEHLDVNTRMVSGTRCEAGVHLPVMPPVSKDSRKGMKTGCMGALGEGEKAPCPDPASPFPLLLPPPHTHDT